MSEFTVKAVSGPDKSAQEIEQDLLDADAAAKEAQETGGETEEQKKTREAAEQLEIDNAAALETTRPELTDENVLSYIKEKQGKEFDSIASMLEKPEPQKVELDAATEKWLQFNRETNRGIEDFVRANKDRSNDDPDTILAEYTSEINEGLSSADVSNLISLDYGYDVDPESDDYNPNEKLRKDLAKKAKIAEAKKYYNDQREKYKAPLESSAASISEDDQASLAEWRQYKTQTGNQQETAQKNRDHFMKSTDELFSSNFEGFKYKIGKDKEVMYKIDNVGKLKESQSDASSFIEKHFDNGILKDPEAYHKSMHIANDPDGFAKYFMELGAAEAMKTHIKDSKNIDMRARNAPIESTNQNGTKVTAVKPTSSGGGGLKVKFLPPNKE